MSTAGYQRLATVDNDEQETRIAQPDPRFNRQSPSWWKRVALLSFIAFLFWLAFTLRPSRNVEPKVIHASRYSKEYKYRPAASPIITERLKDGRVRLRGASPAT
ncbi:hypothetical protein BV22DRAFT_1198022 [Leucogyrophana mollusca]|uniref:Uncharacterized protein n=1 Tax=Leucogyrophana mollusca TaxID=85980 RepID=A0ACB8B7G5_9AGAM|nr:hypothetical protein BV22DRAFT_1198022 [Leucogyrophana mollusca]